MTWRIGLNASLWAGPGSYRGAGISNYIGNILHNLPQEAPEMRFTAWVTQPSATLQMAQFRSCWGSMRAPVRILWEQTVLPILARRAQVDLLHGMAFSLPLLGPNPGVVTIFDMSFALFPQYHAASRRFYLKMATQRAVQMAKNVIAISESSKRDICRLLAVPADKVVVVPCGVSETYQPLNAEQKKQFCAEQGLTHYIYYQGTIEPRKNLVRLLQAYAQLRKWGALEYKLILGGAPGWGYDAVYATVERLGLQQDVRFLGYVPPAQSPLWYGAADLFVYPSLYEGFGLPLLEAMACGTAVIASNISSLPEVVGDAGILVPPEDTEALAAALADLLRNDARREELAWAGEERARSYSWQKAAKATEMVYLRSLA